MSFESELRAVMRAHDAEAPAAVDFVAPPTVARRVRPALLLTAVLVLVLIGATVTALLVRGGPNRFQTAGADGTLPCPGQFRVTGSPWVPAQPTVPDPVTRLVPTDVATSAVVCSYARRSLKPLPITRTETELAGHRAITDLAGLADSLSVQPAGIGATICAQYRVGTDDDNYLIGLSYPDGIVWVSVRGNHCDGSGNGEFASRANLLPAAAKAYATGRWPARDPFPPIGQPARGQCAGRSQGRLGDTEQVVPSGWSTVSVCVDGNHAVQTLSHSDATAIVGDLNGLATVPGNGSCQPAHGGPGTDYLVTAHYPGGPDEDVLVSARCMPQVDNGALEATAPTRLVREVARLAGT